MSREKFCNRKSTEGVYIKKFFQLLVAYYLSFVRWILQGNQRIEWADVEISQNSPKKESYVWNKNPAATTNFYWNVYQFKYYFLPR